MVFGLTLGARTRKFVKIILQKMCSKLIGVATKLLSKFFIIYTTAKEFIDKE